MHVRSICKQQCPVSVHATCGEKCGNLIKWSNSDKQMSQKTHKTHVDVHSHTHTHTTHTCTCRRIRPRPFDHTPVGAVT
jgi:hypothetical protein